MEQGMVPVAINLITHRALGKYLRKVLPSAALKGSNYFQANLTAFPLPHPPPKILMNIYRNTKITSTQQNKFQNFWPPTSRHTKK